MSLTDEQEKNTIEEFKQNLKLLGLPVHQIAKDLNTKTLTIKNILQLTPNSIEEPWILRNYFLEKITEQGKVPISFSALIGDYHKYWFLDAKKIEKKSLSSRSKSCKL